MSNSYSVILPVKPYIKKYVNTIEGSPLQFSSSSMLCIIVRAFMENKNYTGLSREQLSKSISSRTSSIEIIVPIKQMYRIGTSIKPDGIVLINRFLEDCFQRALDNFIKEYTKKDVRYKGFKGAYETFAELYNIVLEEDITYDGLKQKDFRNRKKKIEDSKTDIFSTIVPSL